MKAVKKIMSERRTLMTEIESQSELQNNIFCSGERWNLKRWSLRIRLEVLAGLKASFEFYLKNTMEWRR